MISTVVGNNVETSIQSRYELHRSMCNLKVSRMNLPHSLIWELTLHKLKVGNTAAEVTKNICIAKGEVDYSLVI